MRQRLIKLLNDEINKPTQYTLQSIADHLIANGVIVPPFNIGDDLYYILDGEVLTDEKGVKGIAYYGGENFEIIGDFKKSEVPNTPWNYLSREEAEKTLKGGVEE